MERPDPNYLRLLTTEELCKLATQTDMHDCVHAELARRNSAHKASVRQSTEAAPPKNLSPEELAGASLVPDDSRHFPRHSEFRQKQRKKGDQLERQIKLQEQTNAAVMSVPSADGSLPPGHKCVHGVYIPANSRYRDHARYCSICHPYIILRYSKRRPIIRSKFLWWSPNVATVNNIPYWRPPFRAPHWIGEPRPQGARRVRLQTRFPDIKFLTYLVEELGYDGNAAFAAMVQAHQPWLRSVDRRRAHPVDADPERGTAPRAYSRLVSVVHPYVPAAPGRRAKVGGGLTKEQVWQALGKKRWDKRMKEAVFEIVYRRRSNLQVSNESGIPVETLYVYASRLRREIQEADLHALEKLA